MALVPLDLTFELTGPGDARYKLGANEPPGSRLRNFSFGTKIGEGFSNGSGQLPRRIDLDYADITLVNNFIASGADGSIAYEGMITAQPRDLDQTHTININLAGWMAHAKHRKFREVFVDRLPGNWGEAPIERKAALMLAGVSLGDFSYTSEQGGIVSAFPNQALGAQTLADAWYQAPPGVTIAKLAYLGNSSNFPVGWLHQFLTTDTRDAASTTAYSDTLDATLRTITFTTAQRYVLHYTYSNAAAVTPAAGANVRLFKIAAYGNHGLTLQTGEAGEPDGVTASDVIRNIAARWCPLLDTSGVQNTDYVIQHLTFPERTFPYDAFLEVNKYHLWHLGVWENKRLDFRPYDLTDYDWEIRTDDPGTTFSPQGLDADGVFNGIVVTYTDILTGAVADLTPDGYADLVDGSQGNPWNAAGIQHWDEITLSKPSTAAQALQLGRAALADRNRPRTPGTVTVRGYIRDRAGNEQPVWKVRAGDTIAITNFNDAVRLIVETDYDDEAKQVRLSIDKPFALLDAYLDRVGNALQARGLG
jgi:hypothetical protein